MSLDPLVTERSTDFPGFRLVPTVQARNLSVPGLRVMYAVKDVPDDALIVRLGSQAAASPGEIVIDPGVFQAA